MNSNCIIGSHFPILRNKVELIADLAMGKSLVIRLLKIQPRLSIRITHDYQVISDDCSFSEFLDQNADIIIYSPRWEAILHKLKANGCKNARLYFKFGDPMIHPTADERKVRVIAFFWLLKEILSGRLRTISECKLIYEIKLWGYAGFFHNICISRHYSTFSIGGTRKIPPFNQLNYSDVLWRCLRDEMQVSFSGSRVVDIGCAEGFFAFKATENGATVTAINPPTNSLPTLMALVRHYGKEDSIRVLTGFFPDTGKRDVKAADIVLLLGTLHHFSNLEQVLSLLVASRATLAIEAVFFRSAHPLTNKGMSKGFEPAHHGQEDRRICPRWLEIYLKENCYRYTWIDAWQAFADGAGNNTYSYDQYWSSSENRFMPGPTENRKNATRKLIIAHPLNCVTAEK